MIDPRILNTSYSALLTLHACPRKFQLDRLNAQFTKEETWEESVTFSYGHLVGHGIQRAFEGASETQIYFEMFLMWKPDLLLRNDKQKKSIWEAFAAIQSFLTLRVNGFLDEWELVYHEGKPACELGFCIQLPNGFRYRGFVDAVLRHKISGKIMVLECKTTGAKYVNAAMYKNSAQAVGYSVVLDHLFSDLSSYEVLYLIYLTGSMKYEMMPFDKSYLQRAQWIQELLMDCELIQYYEEKGIYPMHGESCFSYMRECKYLQNCTMSTAFLTEAESAESAAKREEKESTYQINISIEDLIAAQFEKEI